MADLKTYRRKRNFAVTPEPAPGGPAATTTFPRFVVHKHDATRLHYDLRLEIDGALASWAIPKGPSFDPRHKRLAVETEDHPLSYADFEGRIPEGEYGAGDSIVWDRGVYATVPPGQASAMRGKGHLDFLLMGEKLKGRFHLVRTRKAGGKQGWILWKGKDEYATAEGDVVADRPESVLSGKRVTRGPLRKKALAGKHPAPDELLARVWPPMKATLAEAADAAGGGWVLELKYDGFRGVAAISGGRVALRSRNDLDLAPRFPAVARALRDVLCAEAVLDGELVAEDDRFQTLQASAGREAFYAFDLLWLDGEDLRGRPLEERRDLLESLLAHPPRGVGVAERLRGPLDDALAEARARGAEGVVAKRTGSAYRGTRSRDWLKVKVAAGQELAILGYLPLRTGAAGVGALFVGVYDPARRTYRYAGKVGTGFSSRMREALAEALDRDRIDAPPAPDAPRVRAARWARPRLVADVAFTEWTRDGRLRHPSFKGLRDDKRPEECVRETHAPAPRARAAENARRDA